jgi:hypothetical protein
MTICHHMAWMKEDKRLPVRACPGPVQRRTRQCGAQQEQNQQKTEPPGRVMAHTRLSIRWLLTGVHRAPPLLPSRSARAIFPRNVLRAHLSAPRISVRSQSWSVASSSRRMHARPTTLSASHAKLTSFMRWLVVAQIADLHRSGEAADSQEGVVRCRSRTRRRCTNAHPQMIIP